MKSIYIINALFIFFFVGLELIYCFIRKKDYHKFSDSVTSLSSYFSADIFNILMQIPVIFVFKLLAGKYAIFHFEIKSVLNWIICFTAVDFVYYWWHRLSHKVNILWAFHVIHHQSEEYNLAVAVRKGWFTKLTLAFFYVPLVLIGFPLEMLLTGFAFLALYQFILHVRFIGNLGLLELFLCTFSHHRVHHGREPKYLNKNYGGILIIWDKFFGTFQVEEEEPLYGMPERYDSSSLWYANIHYWAEMYKLIKGVNYLKDKLKVLFMPPGWVPEGFGLKHKELFLNIDGENKFGFKIYIFIHFLLGVFGCVIVAESYKSLTLGNLLFFSFITLFTLINVCSLNEKKTWVIKSEVIRYFLIIFYLIFYTFGSFNILSVISIAITLFFIGYILILGNQFKITRQTIT